MPVAILEEKIRRLPEHYVFLVDAYIDQLLERAETPDADIGAKNERKGILPPEWFDKYRGMVSGDIDIEKRKAEYFEEKYAYLHRHEYHN